MAPSVTIDLITTTFHNQQGFFHSPAPMSTQKNYAGFDGTEDRLIGTRGEAFDVSTTIGYATLPEAEAIKEAFRAAQSGMSIWVDSHGKTWSDVFIKKAISEIVYTSHHNCPQAGFAGPAYLVETKWTLRTTVQPPPI